jgi:hypothetical protein
VQKESPGVVSSNNVNKNDIVKFEQGLFFPMGGPT